MEKIRISRNAIVAAVIGAVVGFIFKALLGSLLPIIIGAILGLVLGMFLFPASGKRPQIEVVKTTDPTENLLRGLVMFNKKLRLDPFLQEEILEKLEKIVDKLAEIVPRSNKEHPGSELTYVANRMVTNYLPELLDPYLDLSPQAREGELAKLMKTLHSLEEEIDNIINLVDQRKVNEFRVQDTFLRHKFHEKSVEA